MSLKGNLSAGGQTPSTAYGSATPRSCNFDDLSSDDGDSVAASGPPTHFIVNALQRFFISSCYAPVAPHDTDEFIPDQSPVAPEKQPRTNALRPTLLADKHRKVEIVSKPCMTHHQLDRLESLGLLGYGAFGTVTLVKCGTTGQTLALKAMSKGMIIQKKMQQHIKNEKSAMLRASSPFVIKLTACFNSRQHLYFLMEAALGGDLFAIYQKNRFWGSETHARFYIACISRALEHCHEHSIIYRDIKLENVVLDSQGYAKLCDFGLATIIPESTSLAQLIQPPRAFTACGTPEYMAPEVLTNQGYSFSADWWSLGVVVFELLLGHSPFEAESVKEVIRRVKIGFDKVKLPERADWPDVIRGLCKSNPNERLPVSVAGFQSFQQLPWFRKSKFDWAALAEGTLEAPYVPVVQHSADLGNFDTSSSTKPREVRYSDPATGWDADFEDTIGPVTLSSVSRKQFTNL